MVTGMSLGACGGGYGVGPVADTESIVGIGQAMDPKESKAAAMVASRETWYDLDDASGEKKGAMAMDVAKAEG
jgi:hypothetical protein